MYTHRTKLRSDTWPNQGHVWLCLYNLPGFRVSSRAELPPRRFKVLCRNRHLLIIDPHLKQPRDEKSRHISQGIKLLTSTTDWLNFQKASTCWNLHNTCTLFPLALVAKHYVYGVHFKCEGVTVFWLTSGWSSSILRDELHQLWHHCLYINSWLHPSVTG